MIESPIRTKQAVKNKKIWIIFSFFQMILISRRKITRLYFLHGAGERGSDLELVKFHGIPKLISEGKTFPFITIAPQCPKEGYWDRPEYVSSLISLVKHVMRKYNVRSNQVCGTGLSMGGLEL